MQCQGDAESCGDRSGMVGLWGGGLYPLASPIAHPTATTINSAAWDKAGLARAELTCWVISTELGQVVFCPRPWGLSITGRGRGGCTVQIKTGMEEILNHYFITPLLKKTQTNKQQTHKKHQPCQPPKILPAALFNLFGSCFPWPADGFNFQGIRCLIQGIVLGAAHTHTPESHRRTQHSQHAPSPALLCREVKGTLLGTFWCIWHVFEPGSPKGRELTQAEKERGNKRALPICPVAFNGELFKRYNRGLCVPAEICSGQLLQGTQMRWQKEIMVVFYFSYFFLLQ